MTNVNIILYTKYVKIQSYILRLQYHNYKPGTGKLLLIIHFNGRLHLWN